MAPRRPIGQHVTGKLTGLKAQQRHTLERIFRRHVPPEQVVTSELAHFMAEVSHGINRQVGVLISRRGRVEHVVVGDTERLFLPDLGRHRAGRGRFRGLRLVHTHVSGEPLSRDDLTDLTLLQLDMIAVIQIERDGPDVGRASTLEMAHLVPPGPSGALWEVLPPTPIADVDLPFDTLIGELEDRFAATAKTRNTDGKTTLAVAVHVVTREHGEPPLEQAVAELHELARTAQVEIVETVVQRRGRADPRYVIGRGKLDDLMLATMQHGAELVIFDRDLTPGQVRSIGDATEIKVIDRTQLILDIFAQRATTRDGKLQVELAQLKYTLPRLAGRSTAMSRLAGGIGGRGPGESKLELDRRRAKDRISRLQKQIEILARQRQHRRSRRRGSRVPVVSIVGYTNAGKSTLLNALTGADALAEDKLFATLDPTTRRLRLPQEREVVLTDTVGFIRDLPEDLMAAFKATLEELHEAQLLLHVVDIVTPGWEERVEAVQRILAALDVRETPCVMVFNKVDQVDDRALLDTLCRIHGAVPISALDKESLGPLVEALLGRLDDGGWLPEPPAWMTYSVTGESEPS